MYHVPHSQHTDWNLCFRAVCSYLTTTMKPHYITCGQKHFLRTTRRLNRDHVGPSPSSSSQCSMQAPWALPIMHPLPQGRYTPPRYIRFQLAPKVTPLTPIPHTQTYFNGMDFFEIRIMCAKVYTPTHEERRKGNSSQQHFRYGKSKWAGES